MLHAERHTLRSRTTHRPESWDWRRSLAIFTALAALLSGYRLVIRDSQWWWLAALVIVVLLATCAGLRALGIARAWLGGVAVWLLCLCWIFAPTTLFAVVPTPSSLRAIADLWTNAQAIMVAEQAPVAAAKPVVFVVVAAFGLLAIVADTLASQLHRPNLLGVLFAAIFVVPASMTGGGPDALVFLVAATAWLFLLRLQTQRRSGMTFRVLTSPVVMVAGAALAVGLVLPPVMPSVANVNLSWGGSTPGVFSRGINPILELGQNLRRNTPVTALSYTTTASHPPYLKVVNLFDFTGKSWRPNPTHKYGRIEGSVGLAADVTRREVTTTVTVENLNSQQLPVPYPALRVNGLEGEWRWESDGLTLTTKDSNANGQTYAVKSLQIEPTRTQMRASVTTIDKSLRQYVRLPAKMPSSIAATAAAVTSAATNSYDKALALQTFFRSGDFVYSETAPVAKGFDGNGVDVIAKFLKVKSGYCVHFASAMAVMARTLGIPARIAVGYAPGVQVGTTSDNEVLYEVTSDDLHAWPELYFDDIGWVPFEPTPGVGDVTAFSDPISGDDVRAAQGATGGLNQGNAGLRGAELPDSSTAASTQQGLNYRAGIVIVLGLLMLMTLPILVRTAQRLRRLRGRRRSMSSLWTEVECTARDLGVEVTVAQTPRMFAARLGAWPGMHAEALQRLLSAVERERFGRPGTPSKEATDFVDVVACLRGGATKRQRLRARFLPRSIFGLTTYAPLGQSQPTR